MLERARIASDFVNQTEKHYVDSDLILQNGLAKLIQDIGEAANRVTAALQSENPDIPWRVMIDMRNLLVHDYMEIDFDILWKTAIEDLPPLIAQLEALLATKCDNP